MPYFDTPKCQYFTYDEVVIHNKPHDFWVVIHGHVLDLTKMINLKYLLAFGGKDLSKYFHSNGQPKTEISVNTGQPRVLFPPIVEHMNQSDAGCLDDIWSVDPKFYIGEITKQQRPLRIINTLTGRTHYLVVCEEDTIYDIMRKYKRYNSHSSSYTWRKHFVNASLSGRLNFDWTLSENGLPYDDDCLTPALWLFYENDITIG